MKTNVKINSKIKSIFFDFDLTLVDSKPGAKATYKALSEMTMQPVSKKGFQDYVGSRFSEMIDNLNKRSGVSKKCLIDKFQKVYASEIPKMKFYGKKLMPLLEDHKIIILTNNDKKSVKEVCSYFGIRYDLLVADDDMKKGEKKHDAILRILKKLKLKKNESIYVGDHINDVIEAHKAGIKAVIVPSGVFNKVYIMRYHPDFMVSKIDNIVRLL